MRSLTHKCVTVLYGAMSLSNNCGSHKYLMFHLSAKSLGKVNGAFGQVDRVHFRLVGIPGQLSPLGKNISHIIWSCSDVWPTHFR